MQGLKLFGCGRSWAAVLALLTLASSARAYAPDVYSYSQMTQYFNSIATRPHVRNATVVGTSEHHRSIYGFEVTDGSIADACKQKVVVVAGQHPEARGVWALQGMVDYLLGSSATAVSLRQKAVFYVYPMVSPDRIEGQSNSGPDANRSWLRGSPNTTGTVSGNVQTDQLRDAIITATGGQADWFLDMHNHNTSTTSQQWYFAGDGNPATADVKRGLVRAISDIDAAANGGQRMIDPTQAYVEWGGTSQDKRKARYWGAPYFDDANPCGTLGGAGLLLETTFFGGDATSTSRVMAGGVAIMQGFDTVLPPPIPEPASLGLLAVGTLALLRRRRV